MEQHLDEPALVERSRRGDLGAFNALVAAHQDRVYNLCLRMLGSPQSAEDAAQEAFISAFRNIAKMRGGSVRAWFMRIAANACVDELRRQRRQPKLSLDVPRPGQDDGPERAIDPPDRAAGPEQLVLRGELRAALQAELLRLPDDQRLAVVLCDIEGFSYEEIAVAMSSSVGTVKSRISRGRARLRQALRQRPELFGDLLRPKEGTSYAI
jgi:RNA polymerase sigma-70 factor (ECF subfamily)